MTINNHNDLEYISLYGHAEVYHDQQQINEMYNQLPNNWFHGKEDPNITIIRFTPQSDHYWSTKYGTLIQFAGLVQGQLPGNRLMALLREM